MKINWRKWNNILHRDLGYFFFGLTIIYAVSGVTANHLREWDSNFITEKVVVELQGISEESTVDRELVGKIMAQTGAQGEYKSHFRPTPAELQIFTTMGNIDVNLEAAQAKLVRRRNRPVFREFNYLHLNHAQGLWTWIGDIYAVGLFILAVTGLFVLKGKKGLKGRGKWFVMAGIAVPVIFLLVYFY